MAADNRKQYKIVQFCCLKGILQMNVLKIIIVVVGLVMMLLACGGGSKKSVKGAEDSRILLSSESADLVIPEGGAAGVAVDRRELRHAIASELKSVSEVFNISFTKEFSSYFGLGSDAFPVSLNLRTKNGVFYEGIQCSGSSSEDALYLNNCESGQVVLKKQIRVMIAQIRSGAGGWSGADRSRGSDRSESEGLSNSSVIPEENQDLRVRSTSKTSKE